MKIILIKFLLIVGFSFFVIQPALSQGVEGQNYVISQFGLTEGLPQSSVNDLIQTRDGYIWIATYGGLVRFDGSSFSTFDRSNTPGMESDRILNIFEDSDGGIWLFTESSETQMLRFKDGKCEKFTFPDPSATHLEMYEDDRGVIWLTAFNKTFRFTGNEFAEVPILTDPKLTGAAIQSNSGVWIGYNKQILKTMGDTLVLVYDSIPWVDAGIGRVYAHPHDPNKIWAGTSTGGIIEIDKTNKSLFPKIYEVPFGPLLKIKVGNSGDVFAITTQFITVLEEGRFREFNPLKNEYNVHLKSILEDNEGNYWIGTEGDGLFRLRSSIITMIDGEDGLENVKMLSLTKLKDGTSLFSTNCGGIYEWKNNKATPSAVHNFYQSSCNWSVFQDSKGRIWIGGANPYVTNSLDESGVEFTEKDGYTGFMVFSMMEDEKENIWIGTAQGIFVYNGSSFRNITVEDGLNHADIRYLFEDEQGTVWVGTTEGLNLIDGDSISAIKLLESRIAGEEVKQPWIRAIHEDEDGVMWFGTYGHGLFSLKKGVITNITTQSGLFDNIISHIVEDEKGNFWMGSNRGIWRVSRAELNQFLDGEIESVTSYSYGSAEGMNSAETNGGFQPSTFVDSLGNIYFPTVAGVAVVSTRDVKRNELPPPVYIEYLRTSEKEIPLSSSITLPYDNSFLEINYTGISFSEPQKVKFKYRMKGLSDAWIDVGNQRQVVYIKIPPGEYTFQVIASNIDGIWNTQGASLNVTVIPPFWQTSWFYGLIGFFFISSGLAVYYYRVGQLKKKNEKQKRFTEQLINSQENERRRIAAELHDGLGQQILVIKNRAELAQEHVNDPEGVANQLREIMQSAVISMSDVRSISHDLRPVHLEKFGLTDTITNLCIQLQDTSSVEWSYHIDDIDNIIPVETEINFYRVLQEGTNNILKHAQAKQASIMVRVSQSSIKAVIWDDGQGFDLKMMPTFGGFGFSGMRERIETLGGTLDVQSAIKEGTVIKIDIPFPKKNE